jgi:large subunit ribosomal protein L9
MRLLLLQDVRKLGHLGDIVEVAAGYGRNYLLPQRLAAEPTDENIKGIEDRRRAATAERALRLKQYADLVAQLKDVSITLEAAANPEGTLYGSVAAKDIAAALQAQGYPILPGHVMLDAPIRTLDTRMVKLEFTEDITTEVKVWVVRQGGTPDGSDASNADHSDRDDDTAAAEDAR